MNTEPEPIKYFVYARKSEDNDERQIASISDQVAELELLSNRKDLEVVDHFAEERSAKEPGRPVLNEMMKRIRKGEANGILCWSLNRLARNPVDGGDIQWMLQQGVIRHIQTYDRSYYPGDNVLLMAVELGMANQYVRDLSRDVTRGMRRKAKEGWFPGLAPLGYLNTKFRETRKNYILRDPDRFNMIRRLWKELILEQQLPVRQVHKTVVDEWGLRMRSGRRLGRTTIHKLLKNPFYYGAFLYNGELHEGNHEPMITKEEFDRAQVILGYRSNPKPVRYTFAFTGMIRCGECGAMITAEKKTKRQKNGNVHRYTYYHCTKRVGRCGQKCIRASELDRQITELLESWQAPPGLCAWASKWIASEERKMRSEKATAAEAHKRSFTRCERKLDRLIDMRADGELTEQEFARKKSKLVEDMKTLESLIAQVASSETDSAIELSDDFDFAKTAKRHFEGGDDETKRQILQRLGSNRRLTDKKLDVSLAPVFRFLQEARKPAQAVYDRFEPPKERMDPECLGAAYASDLPVWSLVNDLRTSLIESMRRRLGG